MAFLCSLKTDAQPRRRLSRELPREVTACLDAARTSTSRTRKGRGGRRKMSDAVTQGRQSDPTTKETPREQSPVRSRLQVRALPPRGLDPRPAAATSAGCFRDPPRKCAVRASRWPLTAYGARGGAGRLIATALERAAGLQELGCGAARFATPPRQPGGRSCLKGRPVGGAFKWLARSRLAASRQASRQDALVTI